MTIAARRSCARSFSRLAVAAVFATLAACGGDHGNDDSGTPPTDAKLHCAPEPGGTALAQACSAAPGAAS